MKIKFFLVTALVLSASIAKAQSVEEIMRLSSSSGEMSTSRAMSMGGAFTSLGSDAASIDINPAGLGMYRSGEFNFTVGTNTSSVTSNSTDLNTGSVISNKVNNTRFNLGNMSAIFNVPVYKSSALKSVTFGISYNRSADFNMHSFSESAPSGGSISDFFASELAGIDPSTIVSNVDNPMDVYKGFNPALWGAMMNYNNGMIDAYQGAPNYLYRIDPAHLLTTDQVIQSQYIERSGQINNFSFSMGFNVKDWLYLGMTLGGRSFSYHQSVLYEEWAVENNDGDFRNQYYDRVTNQSGSAFDFKIGATIQPVSGLRIGLAYHAPKVTKISEEYYEDQSVSYVRPSETYSQFTPYALNNYTVVSSQKLLAGVSYRLGSVGILSFDYRLNLNGSVKVKDTGGAKELTDVIKNTIRKNNSEYRVGLELNAYRGLFVRGGFGYIESYNNYANKADKKYGAIRNWSAGLGYKTRTFYIDMAYQNSRSLVEPYFYYGNDAVLPESVIDQKIVNNFVTMTLGFRF